MLVIISLGSKPSALTRRRKLYTRKYLVLSAEFPKARAEIVDQFTKVLPLFQHFLAPLPQSAEDLHRCRYRHPADKDGCKVSEEVTFDNLLANIVDKCF